MIHFHGTPIGGSRQDVARFLQGRHALVPFPRQDDMGIVADVCKSFVLDNGAFSIWKRGGALDIPGYMAWVRDWCRHPGFQWALIPDVIDGSETQNIALVKAWRDSDLAQYGVPVWHMHESIEWLYRLCNNWPIVALGSSGQWATPGTAAWWNRMSIALNALREQEPVAWGDEPWMASFGVRVGRDSSNSIDLIFTTVGQRKFQLYAHEAAYLRGLLNKAEIPGYPNTHPAPARELTDADIALCIASADKSFAQERISGKPVLGVWSKHLARAIERHLKGEAA